MFRNIVLSMLPFVVFSQAPKIEYDEKTICFLEEQIPELAEAAFKMAYWQVLSSGSSVLVARDGFLIEVFPNGTETIIKELPKPTPVIKGKYIIFYEGKEE